MEKNWGDTPSATLTNQLTTPKSFFLKTLEKTHINHFLLKNCALVRTKAWGPGAALRPLVGSGGGPGGEAPGSS